MPLPLPDLDNRTWVDLTDEGRAMIPAWAPEWTNYNPSDPGITLIELFAYLTEILLYRLNRVSDENLKAFLKLINGPDWICVGDVQSARRDTLRKLAEYHRAVTAQDFERIALSVNDAPGPGFGKISRVSCIQGRNLPNEWEGAPEPDVSADVSVVVLTASSDEHTGELLRRVRQVLDRARLLCTRVHVLLPRYVSVRVQAKLTLRRNCRPEDVRNAVVQALRSFFDPFHGGPDGCGWPFGRDIYLSELFQLLAPLPGIAAVSEIVIVPAEQSRLRRNRLQEIEAVDLGPGELVRAEIDSNDIVAEPQEKNGSRH